MCRQLLMAHALPCVVSTISAVWAVQYNTETVCVWYLPAQSMCVYILCDSVYPRYAHFNVQAAGEAGLVTRLLQWQTTWKCIDYYNQDVYTCRNNLHGPGKLATSEKCND